MSIDHYKFWQVGERKFSETMELFGQCDKSPWTAEIGSAMYLGNPVDKVHDGNHVPIGNQKLHYVAYAIGEHAPQPRRRVTFSNQFTDGDVTWDLGEPVFLLVPAGKVFEGQPPIPPGDHFVCYTIAGGEPVKTNVTLEDQFDVLRQKPEEINLLIPRLYGVPVEKRRDGKEPEVPKDKKTQLAIYEFLFDSFDTVVNTADQLASHKLQVQLSQWLAVPSLGKCEVLPPT